MTQCWHQASGVVELYFYGELAEAERGDVERHIAGCADCRRTLEELEVIRAALDARPDIAAPPGGDWSHFMARLDSAISQPLVEGTGRTVIPLRRPLIAAALGMAALLALVTITALVVMRQRSASSTASQTVASETAAVAPGGESATADDKDPDVALTELSEQHFERSKLVVLGLATKDPQDSAGLDWDYERELASSLLTDTRLYRQTAEEHGMKNLADVMRDLELVLLQTSMSDSPDAESLGRLQRLIRQRDLITKMDVVKTTGLAP
jgi:putative zinc finger protein